MRVPAHQPTVRNFRNVSTGFATMGSSIASGWAVEHNSDGTHKTDWTDIVFDASQFSASGSLTVTITPGEVIQARYRLQGTTLHLKLWARAFTLGGTASSQVYYKLPANLKSTKFQGGPISALNNATDYPGIWLIQADADRVGFTPTAAIANWATGTAHIVASMEIEVQR